MIKVEYGLPKDELNRRYLQLFDLGPMGYAWQQIRRRLTGRKGLSKIPVSLNDILTANYPKLVDIFQVYQEWNGLDETLKKDIATLFDYDKYQPKIAGFFMESQNGFELHTCHYCGTAYINAYGFMQEYGDDVLTFIKNASREALKKYIPGDLSDRTIQMILDNRDSFTSLADFDALSCWRSANKSDTIKTMSDNHFDLDHELDKGSCLLVALSLYNFVPSCQVCNEKLKRSQTIGNRTNKAELIKLSPTSDGYDFDRNVTFSVTPKTASTFGFMRNNEKYSVEVNCQDPDYEKSVELFRLKQRYNYHKVFALRLLDLKERYSDGSIKMISNLLQRKTAISARYTEQQIHEDIFGEEYSKVGHRCFDKLRRDVLNTGNLRKGL